MINLNTIKNNINNEIIIKNSKFITCLIKVNDVTNIKNILSDIKKKYPNATHYCYGYIVGNNIKTSDDNEPSGTASKPILDILNKNDLNNIICIIIRYFGGIKLGVGGLLRAYSTSISECLKKAIICQIVNGKNIIISFNYNIENDINYLLRNEIIISKKYDKTITYKINIKDTNIIDKLKTLNITIISIKDIKLEG